MNDHQQQEQQEQEQQLYLYPQQLSEEEQQFYQQHNEQQQQNVQQLYPEHPQQQVHPQQQQQQQGFLHPMLTAQTAFGASIQSTATYATATTATTTTRGTKVKIVGGYVLQEKLGSGSFAVVYKGVRLPQQQNTTIESTTQTTTTTGPAKASTGPAKGSTGPAKASIVAIKAITRTSEKLTKKVLQNLEVEIQILRTYRHRNIVCLQDVQKTQDQYYLFLEYCGGGDLQKLIRSRHRNNNNTASRLSEGLTRRLMRDLSAGLKFLWSQQLIHRDIKPQNLLLTGPLPCDEVNDPEQTPQLEQLRIQTNFPTSEFCLKIADFGFARHLQATSLAETLCGSPLYMAPEILSQNRYDAKADLWSVGTVLFEMITGRPPFTGENHIDLLRNIQRRAVRLPPDVKVSKECVTLLRLLLNRNPMSRAGFAEFFPASRAFCALGCQGIPTPDNEGTTVVFYENNNNRNTSTTTTTTTTTPASVVAAAADATNRTVTTAAAPNTPIMDLGTIPESNEGSGVGTTAAATTTAASAAASSVFTNIPLPQQQHQRPMGIVTPPLGPKPSPSIPIVTSSSSALTTTMKQQQQQQPTRPMLLQPLVPSPPTSSPLFTRLVVPSTNYQQQQQLPPSPRNQEPTTTTTTTPNTTTTTFSCNEENSFVMVEHGSFHRSSPYNNNNNNNPSSPPSTGNTRTNNNTTVAVVSRDVNTSSAAGGAAQPTHYYFYDNSNTAATATTATAPGCSIRGDYMVVVQPPHHQTSSKVGMLSTSPGTGGALMNLLSSGPSTGRTAAPVARITQGVSYDATTTTDAGTTTTTTTGTPAARTTKNTKSNTACAEGNNNNTQQVLVVVDAKLAEITKLLAAAEDVGRRAISVAHLGDHRAYSAMRLLMILLSNESSCTTTNNNNNYNNSSATATVSLLSGTTTAMEGIEEEDKAAAAAGIARATDSSSTEIMASTTVRRRRSSSATDKSMTDAKGATITTKATAIDDDVDDDDDADEMPFAVVTPESPPLLPAGLPTRGDNINHHYNRASSKISAAAAGNPALVKPTRGLIRLHFGEALACYVKALTMLKGAVAASHRVPKELDDFLVACYTPTSQQQQQQFQQHRQQQQQQQQRVTQEQIGYMEKLKKRCHVTANWLGQQFKGVLERADATNMEISKLAAVATAASSTNSQQQQQQGKQEQLPMSVTCVEELIYNHALTFGREGAVKQLLGQFEAARASYRTAGLLAETLLMEAGIGPEDRKILEDYVDGFAARITELDEVIVVSQQQQQQQQQKQQVGLVAQHHFSSTTPFSLDVHSR